MKCQVHYKKSLPKQLQNRQKHVLYPTAERIFRNMAFDYDRNPFQLSLKSANRSASVKSGQMSIGYLCSARVR